MDLSALLRTFCLHDETIWSMCHWTSAWPGQPPASVATASLPSETMLSQSASAAHVGLHTAPGSAPAPDRFANRPGVRAASACAIRGAARPYITPFARGSESTPTAASASCKVLKMQDALTICVIPWRSISERR
ncbi:hypothetical protein SAMN05216466_102576 [Paraburkholderia phenazinium]|uniref:Uncharacterized protein n=1 Tax=Paraburkholderia phenazinium TaxID=60549 RepID=A0A1G7SM43_9BURK|nr:hypothetical protein SAMN05216466_102576 [Paraburkholderia phenazinium]